MLVVTDWVRAGAVLATFVVATRIVALLASVLFGGAPLTSAKSAGGAIRPKGTLPLLRNTLQFLRRSGEFHDFMADISAEAQDRTVQVKILGRPEMIVVATPELFEDVLKTHFGSFEKGPYLASVLSDLLGDGIFAVDGAKWARQRKTASNLFSLRALRDSMAESVHKHARVLARVLQRRQHANTPVDIASLMNRFTIETFAEIGFGVDLESLEHPQEDEFARAFDSALCILAKRFVRPPWFWRAQRWLEVGVEGELKRNIRVIHDTVLDIIVKSMTARRSRRDAAGAGSLNAASSSQHTKRDLVSLFLDNASYDGASTSAGGDDDAAPDESELLLLRDIVVNFLIAGRDTTSQALSWLLYMLAKHPEVETKIREELARELPELASGALESPSMEQVGRLVYLEAAIRESLRLNTPAPGNLQQATKDVVLSDGTFVKAGWNVSVGAYRIGRAKSVWGPDAKEYKPERWLDPVTGKIISVSAFKFAVFNAGPRMCLGVNLAMLEIKIVMASLLSKFRFDLVPGQTIRYDLSLTLPIKGSLMMTIHPASATATVACQIPTTRTGDEELLVGSS